MTRDEDRASLDAVNRFYAAEAAYLVAERRDFGPIAATLDPDCVIYEPASLPYGGEWRGHGGFERWMIAFADTWASLDVTDPELLTVGDVVVSRSHVRATSRATGRVVEWPLLQYFKLRQAKILELCPFHWDTADIAARLRA